MRNCRLVISYRSLGGDCSNISRPWRWWQQTAPKRIYQPSSKNWTLLLKSFIFVISNSTNRNRSGANIPPATLCIADIMEPEVSLLYKQEAAPILLLRHLNPIYCFIYACYYYALFYVKVFQTVCFFQALYLLYNLSAAQCHQSSSLFIRPPKWYLVNSTNQEAFIYAL